MNKGLLVLVIVGLLGFTITPIYLATESLYQRGDIEVSLETEISTWYPFWSMYTNRYTEDGISYFTIDTIWKHAYEQAALMEHTENYKVLDITEEQIIMVKTEPLILSIDGSGLRATTGNTTVTSIALPSSGRYTITFAREDDTMWLQWWKLPGGYIHEQYELRKLEDESK